MSKARDLADFISTGSIFTDGAIASTEITGVTADASEINKLDGVTASTAEINKLTGVTASTAELNKLDGLNASTAELNNVVGSTSALQTQLDNISVTSGSLTKTFTQNETADITLSQSITSAPVVSVTKEVPQTGVSTKGNWDVNSTASNYDFHNTAANVTLTPSTVQVANVSLASYANKASGSLGFTGLRGVWFKPDGTKMFTMDRPNAQIVQQNLSTAWDVSTQSNSGSYFQFTSGITTSNQPYGLWFNSDGTKLFVNNLNDVHGFTLSTAWDLSTISLVASNTVPTTAYDNETRNIFFKPDGTRLYIVGTQTDRVYEYTLPTAFDLSSIVNDAASRQLSVQAQANSPRHIYFNSTGTTFYIVDDTGSIYEYSLTTAWDISTASYTNNSFDTSSQGSGAQAMFLGNGNMYVVNDSTNQAYQYNFSQAGLVLGSGSFASTDVGKRIVGNGGDVVLTSTGGAYDTTGGSAFTDNSTIAAGSWSMFGLKSAGDADGITISSLGTETATYDSQLSLASQTTSPQDVDFNLDGGKAFIVNNQSDTITQYNLSTPYLLSSASAVYNFSVSAQDGIPTGIFVAQTKMIVCGYSSNKLHLYNLGSNYNLSGSSFYQDFNLNTNGSYSNGTRGVTCQLDASGNIAQIFTVSESDTNVRHWTPAALNQVSNLSLTRSLDLANVSGITGTPQGHGIRFNNDGTRLFIVDENAEAVYRLGLTTAYDISTASHEITYDISANSTQPMGIAIGKSDDSLMFITTNTGDYLNKYILTSNFTQPTSQYHVAVTNSGGQIDSSAFTDINSMTAAESAGTGTAHYAVSTDGRTTWSVAKGTDGVRPIVRNNSGTWQYNSAESAWGISSAAYTNKSLNVNSIEPNPTGIFFKPDGTKMYMNGYTNDDVNEYNLSTAWDITTATYSQNFGLSSQDISSQGIFFKPDGTKMYMVGSGSDNINEYTLSTAWDVSTLSYVRNLGMPSGLQNPTGIFFKSDGTRMYIVADPNKAVMYSLSTAWDISTASVSHTHTISETALPQDIFLKSDGTKVYILGESSDQRVYEYNLSTAYDLSTISYSSYNFDVSSQATGCKGMTFKPDGSKMYIIGTDNDTIFEYNTLSYGTSTTWTNGTVNDELYTLQQALSVESNRMDKTQLDAVADANHFTLGNSLDLMIALRMDTAASTLPTSDGVTLNYDAAALNEGAVLGTDYDFFFPANNKVQIKSLAAQNLKVRVV